MIMNHRKEAVRKTVMVARVEQINHASISAKISGPERVLSTIAPLEILQHVLC
jgi:hypothetical protein